MMMIDNRKQFTEHLVREVARRIVPMALEAIGNAKNDVHAKNLRGLADDASMNDVYRACYAAADDYSAASVIRATIAANAANAAITDGACPDTVADAYTDAVDCATNAADYAIHASGMGAVARQEYAAILYEATPR